MSHIVGTINNSRLSIRLLLGRISSWNCEYKIQMLCVHNTSHEIQKNTGRPQLVIHFAINNVKSAKLSRKLRHYDANYDAVIAYLMIDVH